MARRSRDLLMASPESPTEGPTSIGDLRENVTMTTSEPDYAWVKPNSDLGLGNGRLQPVGGISCHRPCQSSAHGQANPGARLLRELAASATACRGG